MNARTASLGSTPGFLLGIEALLATHSDWLTGARLGLVSHRAACDRHGLTSAERLHAAPGLRLTALFGPEHGFTGQAGAGELTASDRHPDWQIPIFSLYGDTRQPTPAMLEHVDILVIDLQDLGARPYTYVSTLRLVLEAAHEARKTVVVADRPVPLPGGADGPLLDPAFGSFVGLVPAPMQYGMTQAETALWLRHTLGLSLDLRVAPMRGYFREPVRQDSWPGWIAPSPRIRSWETACLFTATVFGEALSALDYGSGTAQSFQVIGAPWLDAAQLRDALDAEACPGVAFAPVHYRSATENHAGQDLDGLQILVTDYARFRPVTTSVLILDVIQRLHGVERLWSAPGTRAEWFDKLYGTDRVRRALQDKHSWRDIASGWLEERHAFDQARAASLLYQERIVM